MKKLLIAGVLATALAFTVSASAALVPGVYDPGKTGCVEATFIKKTKTLHLEKNCPTATNASAGAEVTGVSGRTFQSASFTLASATQCQGGSPRFNVDTTTGFFFLGCNNVTPTTNADGSVTYTFTAATLAASGQQVPTPTGTIESVTCSLTSKAPLTSRRSWSTASCRSSLPATPTWPVHARRAAGRVSRAPRSRTRASA